MPKTVADVMSRDPIVVRAETPLKEAIQILAERHISGLPVVDDAGKLRGHYLRNRFDVARNWCYSTCVHYVS